MKFKKGDRVSHELEEGAVYEFICYEDNGICRIKQSPSNSRLFAFVRRLSLVKEKDIVELLMEVL